MKYKPLQTNQKHPQTSTKKPKTPSPLKPIKTKHQNQKAISKTSKHPRSSKNKSCVKPLLTPSKRTIKPTKNPCNYTLLLLTPQNHNEMIAQFSTTPQPTKTTNSLPKQRLSLPPRPPGDSSPEIPPRHRSNHTTTITANHHTNQHHCYPKKLPQNHHQQ